ncbi:MAG TPA: hypothetical protein VFZ58_01140 [Candidatus Saccharimonadales bacterium]
MAQLPVIIAKGNGIETLKAYFEMHGSSLPHKLPPLTDNWEDEASYDAPHGVLTVWKDGDWEATFSLNSVATVIKGIPGITVGIPIGKTPLRPI